MQFNVVPTGKWFEEIADTICEGFHSIGHKAERLGYVDNSGQHINLILGAHLLPRLFVQQIGNAPAILYNFEQVDDFKFPAHSEELFRKYPIWDYSKHNLQAWERRGIKVKHVPVGYSLCASKIHKSENEDIDVLFYGIANERRTHILQKISESGLKVEIAQGVWGKERDELIARAKVVVNIHFNSTGIFEIVRCSHLFANRKAVISELSVDGYDYRYMDSGIVWTDDLIRTVPQFVRDDYWREQIADNGFKEFSRLDEGVILQAALCGMEKAE